VPVKLTCNRSRIQTGMHALAVISITLSLGSCTERSPPQWLRATNTECLIWNPSPRPDESVTWKGPCVDGKADGTGTWVFRSPEKGVYKEQRYVGQMKAGKTDGHGVLYFANGDQFEGEFVDGMRARGTYRYASGDLYTGPYKNDKPNGLGTLTSATWRYEGSFVDGHVEGSGTATDIAGSQYHGQFHHGVPNGHGTLRLGTGQVFTGQWLNGCMNERGQRMCAFRPPY
jgi:hypothetical protein